APRRPSAAQDRRSGQDPRAPHRRALSGLWRGRHHHPLARCRAREDRRRDHDRLVRTPRRRGRGPRRGPGTLAMTAPLRVAEPATVRVALPERAYDIVIGRGLIAWLGARIAALRPAAAVAIVTDETVARHHLAAAEAALAAAGLRSARIVVPPGEGSKSW